MNNLETKHIIVGLSGGVDSAVAAYLLKQTCPKVEAVFMKNWEEDVDSDQCTYATDLADARAICEVLEIPLTCVNFSEEYWQYVFSFFLDELTKGRTPNPDILCNKEIKFKAFLNYAKHRGADFIATGHYVRRCDSQQNTMLLKGADENKDQSYFLHTLTKDQIAHSLFPIGHLSKRDVRTIANKLGLKVANKKDSTGICFIGERHFKQFLAHYLPATPGPIETLSGNIVGQHEGLIFYTIGQRQGLNIGGLKDHEALPWYVVDKDIKRNVLIVVQGNDPSLYQTTVFFSHLHWINQSINKNQPKLKAKTRYRQSDQSCRITKTANNHFYRATFNIPQRAITPGQSIVFYQDDICLGGGIIEQTKRNS